LLVVKEPVRGRFDPGTIKVEEELIKKTSIKNVILEIF
jgi:hypothetical protein